MERYVCEHCDKHFYGTEAKRGVQTGMTGVVEDTTMICPHCNEPTQGIIDNIMKCLRCNRQLKGTENTHCNDCVSFLESEAESRFEEALTCRRG